MTYWHKRRFHSDTNNNQRLNVVVFGGYGIIGSEIVNMLQNHHNVFVVDQFGDIDNEDPLFRGMAISDISQLFMTENNIPNVIIDVTDGASLSEVDDSSNIYNNVANAARLMDICRMQCNAKQNQVTLFTGVWADPPPGNSSVFAYSCHLRKELSIYFNKVNTVIAPVNIPRIIDGRYAASSYGAVISRILDCFDSAMNQTKAIIFHDYELQIENRVLWSTTEIVATYFLSHIYRKSRRHVDIKGIKADSLKVVGFLLENLDIDEIEIQTIKSGRIIINRRYGDEGTQDEQLKEWIRRSIQQYRNDNSETKPD